ncbi:MAG: UDP-N-acetylglucosamine 2-epimerase [Solirubrobacterales bacterium]
MVSASVGVAATDVADTPVVVVIVGIRSQFIKLAAFQRGIARWRAMGHVTPGFCFVNAGQHYDDELARQYLDELDVQIDVDLTRSRTPSTVPTEVAAEMLVALHALLSEYAASPGVLCVVVFGDADTTLAGALAARRAGLPIVHVEAGVRTGDRRSVEESNRLVADRLADLHFASTRRDLEALQREGLDDSSLYVGDIVHDLVRELAPALEPPPEERLGYSLVTLHRAENTADSATLGNILEVLAERNARVVLIAHSRTQRHVAALDQSLRRVVTVRDSLPYRQFLALLRGARYVVTDSGAVQRESFYLERRVLVRQDHVFWRTLVDGGVHRQVGGEQAELVAGCEWIDAQAIRPYPALDDFGEGDSVESILSALAERDWLRRA